MSVKDKWWSYHQNNPHVWDLFQQFTFEAIKSGHSTLSAWLIVNRIRWETDVVTKDTKPFKISNDYIAYYARYFMHVHPRHKGLFKIKPLTRA